jgi:hypothetical protein
MRRLSASNQIPRVVSVAYAATVTPNADTTDLLIIGTLTGPLTLAAPSGTPYDGQMLKIRFVQDATGRAITFNSIYLFGTDITSAMIPVTGNAKFQMMMEYSALETKWRVTALARGF